jgi:hypothetical protein
MVMPLYVGWELDACPVARVFAAILVCDAQRDRHIGDGGSNSRRSPRAAATMHLKNQPPVALPTWYCVKRYVAARSKNGEEPLIPMLITVALRGGGREVEGVLTTY